MNFNDLYIEQSEKRIEGWSSSLVDGCSCTRCNMIKELINEEGSKMSNYYGNSGYAKVDTMANELMIERTVEKFAVMTNGAQYKGSWAKEEDAISFIKREIKSGSKQRYIVLEAKKEIGTKSPEIEIEEL